MEIVIFFEDIFFWKKIQYKMSVVVKEGYGVSEDFFFKQGKL